VDGAIYSIAFDATDAAGNVATRITRTGVTYDVTAPTMVITAAEGADGLTSNDATLTLTFTSSEPTTNFAEEDISVDNGALSDFVAVSPTVYTATFTPTADGAATIDVAGSTFKEAADNENTVAEQFTWTYDVTAPTISSTAPAQNASIKDTKVSYTLSETVA